MEITSSEKNRNPEYLVFFDLDRTLTKSISGREIAKTAFRKGYMKRTDLASAIYLSLSYRSGILHPVRAMERMLGWVKGLDEQVLVNICREVSEKSMIPSIYKDAPAEISLHSSKNARIVMLSASLEPVCRDVAVFLKIDDIICSKLESVGGRLTGRPNGKLCYGDEKVEQLRIYCKKYNIKPEDTWYYGDSIADIPVLKAVGNPVCINPDRALRRIALKYYWRIYFWE